MIKAIAIFYVFLLIMSSIFFAILAFSNYNKGYKKKGVSATLVCLICVLDTCRFIYTIAF